MPRKYNTKHNRTPSRYRLKRYADRYGSYHEGEQRSADVIAGTTSIQRKPEKRGAS